ncbi:MAG: ribosome biogenesis GTPase Der [Eubacterium aggregans]|uniref:GTPase Der n=1 Tax=Eubacterium aggregans TaxID=81409 RepID=A0A1H3YE76_9FIRM|nr:ribosome biogenesis GTPase Der [Eubacterium aggregans]MDD4691296.1 ribosome biogenesis GTPase Der [Eubacterium aggregans]MEA5072786.1 ribosome biogenesis GTPase Der [Eubacterium aggregans]SEA09294.1 GTP-binding protein [Eubacterium aggregans]
MAKPIVAVVGRPNVGKSTLFNKLVGERIAIVEDTPGVTRDRIISDAEWQNHHFTLIDTGGIEPAAKDDILFQMRVQAEVAMDMADLILLLVDGRGGMTAADEEVAGMIRKRGKNVVLAVNKLDTKNLEDALYEFYTLGLGEPLPISGEQGLGLGDLLDAIIEKVKKVYDEEEQEDNHLKVAVVGKPNAGKSTLINKMLGEDRLIVSDVAGTTRDAVDTDVKYHGKIYTLIDTAGLRRKNKIYDDIERYSIIRAVAAVERADVVLILIDAEQGVTEQDSKIAGIAHNRSKPSIIVVNKWDSVAKDDKTMKKMTEDIRKTLSFMPYAPMMFISAKTGQRVSQLYEKIDFVKSQSEKRISTGKLNEAITSFVMMKQPPSKSGRRLKIFYASQPAINPPTFVLFVNDASLMHFSYERYLENKINETFDFFGTPIRLFIRERKEKN